MSTKTVLALSVVLAAVSFPMPSEAQLFEVCGQKTREEINVNLYTFLHGGGIDLQDQTSLLIGLRRGDSLSAFAADALGYCPPSEEVDRALLEAMHSQREVLMWSAVHSLAMRKNFAWVDETAKRFADIKDPIVRIRLAGDLALGGHYEGWPLIRSILVEKQERQILFTEATRQLPKFNGMKGEDGKPINMRGELDRMLQVAPPEHKRALLRLMDRYAPPVRPAPPRK